MNVWTIINNFRNQSGVWTGVIIFLALNLLGLVNLTHADTYSNDTFHDAQLVWTMIGFSVAVVLMLVDVSILYRLAAPAYWLGIFLLLVVFLFDPVNYSHRWISFGSFSLQPSEFMKVALALQLAAYFRDKKSRDRRNLRALMRPLGYTLLPAILVLIEPDLGTSLVICGIGLAVMLFEGVHTRSFLTLVGIVLLLFPLAWKFNVIRSYQKARIQLWLGVEPEGADWKEKHSIIIQKTLQPERARWSIGSGKLAGKGALKGSRIRLKYLPEMHTDFVVATLAEEYGFIGCILMLFLFYLYISWCIRMAQNATDRFGALAAFGIASMVAIQVFVNLGMVTGVLPVVGVTLPLFSYGGSSLVACMAGFGIIMSVSGSKGSI